MPVHVGLPREPDSVVRLNRARSELAPAIGRGDLRHLRPPRGAGPDRRPPSTKRTRPRPRLLGREQHVGDLARQPGTRRRANRTACLADVLNRHRQRAVTDPDEFGRDRHERAINRTRATGPGSSSPPSPRTRPPDGRGRSSRRARLLTPRPGRRRRARRRSRPPPPLPGSLPAGRQRFAIGEAWQPPRALLVAARVRDQRAREDGRQERHRRGHAAQLLALDRQLDMPESLTAVSLGDGESGPAELRQLTPKLFVRRGPLCAWSGAVRFATTRGSSCRECGERTVVSGASLSWRPVRFCQAGRGSG